MGREITRIRLCKICSNDMKGGFKTKYCSKKCHDKSKRQIDYKWREENKEIALISQRAYKSRNLIRIRENDKIYQFKKRNRNKLLNFILILPSMIYCKKFSREKEEKDRIRNLTQYIYKKFNINRFCVICKNESKLVNYHIHHEIYPNNEKEIIKAIIERKIYMLCKDCHKILHRGLIIFDKSNKVYTNYIYNKLSC